MFPAMSIEKIEAMIKYCGFELAYSIFMEYTLKDELGIPNETLLVAIKPHMCNYHFS